MKAQRLNATQKFALAMAMTMISQQGSGVWVYHPSNSKMSIFCGDEDAKPEQVVESIAESGHFDVQIKFKKVHIHMTFIKRENMVELWGTSVFTY
jgi:hypothetical protein